MHSGVISSFLSNSLAMQGEDTAQGPLMPPSATFLSSKEADSTTLTSDSYIAGLDSIPTHAGSSLLD